MEEKKKALALLLLLVLLGGFSQYVSAASLPSSPARFISGFFSSLLSALLKRLWSLTPTTKAAISSRSNVKFESGYKVETVFDGSKLGIEPFTVEILPSGELVLLDSVSSNIYRISQPLSRYSRPKLIAGSAEGYTGHVDGKPREARMNHPKGLAVDDRGNIYVADTMNKAIRKISGTGVTTIAGGKWNRGGHADGPSEDAQFSNDFEVVYIGSSCSLLVVDRGNRAIREIQLHFDDCAYQYGTGFPLGIAVLLAAGFFGYMLAMLQRWLGVMASSNNDAIAKSSCPPSPYQQPIKSVRPPLIPPEHELGKQEEEGLFASIGKLISGAGSSISLIFRGMFSRKKLQSHQFQNQYQLQHQNQANAWPQQESFVVPQGEEPPPVEARTPTTSNPRKTYAFMSKEPEKLQQLRRGQAYFNGWDGGEQQQRQTQHKQQQQLRKHQQSTSGPQTYYHPTCETTEEIVFGAVQESGSRYGAMEMKAVNYGDPFYDQYGCRHRYSYMRYQNDY